MPGHSISNYRGAFTMPAPERAKTKPAKKEKAAKKLRKGDVPPIAAYLPAGEKPERPPSFRVHTKTGLRSAEHPWTLENMVYVHDRTSRLKDASKGRQARKAQGALFDYVTATILYSGNFPSIAKDSDWDVRLKSYSLPHNIRSKGDAARWINTIQRWAVERPSEYSTYALAYLESLANFANSYKVNPIDIADWFDWYLQSAGGRGPSFDATKGGQGIPPQTVLTIGAILQSIGGSGFRLKRDVASEVVHFLSLEQAPQAFITRSDAKPLAPSTPKTGRVLGMEIVEIVYAIPTSFDADGKPNAWRDVSHKTVAPQVAAKLGLTDPKQTEAVLSQTIAGRCYLAFSEDRKNVFIATSFPPRKPVFSVGDVLPEQAAAIGESSPFLNGLVV